MADVKLRPCPFCGGEAEIQQMGDRRKSMIVACTNCGCRLESSDEGTPRMWNGERAGVAHAKGHAGELAERVAKLQRWDVGEAVDLVEDGEWVKWSDVEGLAASLAGAAAPEETESPWVASATRLPDRGVKVLVYFPLSIVKHDLAWWDTAGWDNANWHRAVPINEGTHWQPLPLPPASPDAAAEEKA